MRVPRLSSVIGFGLVLILVINGVGCSSAAPAKPPEKTAKQETETAAVPGTEQAAAQDTKQVTAKTESKPSAKAVTPATLAEAEKVLDLETFPLPAGAKSQGPRRMATLSYAVEKPSQEILDFNVQELTKRGWK
ncbi:MAG TPA: hypothetical protein DCM07_04095, partial [Planctomycetaceae bacterium]|nr:hypothetical protein [Planctomycetaceae bacterium]